MAKQRINPIRTTTPVVDKSSFQSSDLQTSDEVNAAVVQLKAQSVSKSKNKAKKETEKGTVVFSAMVEIELMKKLRTEAAATEVTMSDILNAALREYFEQ